MFPPLCSLPSRPLNPRWTLPPVPLGPRYILCEMIHATTSPTNLLAVRKSQGLGMLLTELYNTRKCIILSIIQDMERLRSRKLDRRQKMSTAAIIRELKCTFTCKYPNSSHAEKQSGLPELPLTLILGAKAGILLFCHVVQPSAFLSLYLYTPRVHIHHINTGINNTNCSNCVQ